MENIEVDYSYYMVGVSKIGKRNFDRNLAKIPPCYAAEEVYTPQKDATYFLNLHPCHGFIWAKEQVENQSVEEVSMPPIRWTMVDENDF